MAISVFERVTFAIFARCVRALLENTRRPKNVPRYERIRSKDNFYSRFDLTFSNCTSNCVPRITVNVTLVTVAAKLNLIALLRSSKVISTKRRSKRFTVQSVRLWDRARYGTRDIETRGLVDSYASSTKPGYL